MDTSNAAAWSFFLPKPFRLLHPHERWRRIAGTLKLSREARARLEWIIYSCNGHNATQTARHFGISRKTFYKWFGQFDRDNLSSLNQLENKSPAPHRVRQREITPLQEQRIIQIRKKHIRWGKQKLAVIYVEEFQEKISSWKIQKVIESWKLYYHPEKALRIRLKRKKAQKKKRITELQLDRLYGFQKKVGYILCLDTVEIRWNNLKRYIFTAIDKYGKAAYARMYKNKSSQNGADFLYRLHFLWDGRIPRVGHDNGSEFEKYFKLACNQLAIEQYYSRVRTPQDNPNNERFNRTLQEEFIDLGNFHSDPEIFNRRMTEWLIEYNYQRPHEALNYQTPMKASHLSPMYSSCTNYIYKKTLML